MPEFKCAMAIPYQSPHKTCPLWGSGHSSQEGSPSSTWCCPAALSEGLGAHGDGTGQALPAGNQTAIVQSAKSGVAVQSHSPSKHCHLLSLSGTPSFTTVSVLMWLCKNRTREPGAEMDLNSESWQQYLSLSLNQFFHLDHHSFSYLFIVAQGSEQVGKKMPGKEGIKLPLLVAIPLHSSRRDGEGMVHLYSLTHLTTYAVYASEFWFHKEGLVSTAWGSLIFLIF